MTLTTANQTAADARQNIPLNFVYLDVAGQPLWAWSGRGDLTVTSATDPLLSGGQTFMGAGDIGSIGTITHAADGSVQSMQLGLSYTDLVDAEASDFINDVGAWSQRDAVVWQAFARTVGGGAVLVDVPFRLMTARMVHVSSTNGKSPRIVVRLASRAATDGQRASRWRLADAHQRAFYPSDGALSYIPLLMNRELRFGIGDNNPRVPGGGNIRDNEFERRL